MRTLNDQRKNLERFKDNFEPAVLHEDLQPYINKLTKSGWTALQHPLVQAVPYNPALNRQLNRTYASKQVRLGQAQKDRNWETVIWLHERPWRLAALLKIEEELGEDQYWNLVRMIWIDSDHGDQNLEEWVQAWTGRDYIPQLIMDTPDFEHWFRLSDPVDVYRGYDPKFEKPMGLSWTTSPEIAQMFASRYGEGRVACGRVHKRDVLAYFGEMAEEEVVVLPGKVEMSGGHLPTKEEGASESAE